MLKFLVITYWSLWSPQGNIVDSYNSERYVSQAECMQVHGTTTKRVYDDGAVVSVTLCIEEITH